MQTAAPTTTANVPLAPTPGLNPIVANSVSTAKLSQEYKSNSFFSTPAPAVETELHPEKLQLPLKDDYKDTGKLLGSKNLHESTHFVKGVHNIAFGLRHGATAAKVAAAERMKHRSQPPTYIPDSLDAGLVAGSRGNEPTLNELLQKEADELTRAGK